MLVQHQAAAIGPRTNNPWQAYRDSTHCGYYFQEAYGAGERRNNGI
jgi:hypothetical protein